MKFSPVLAALALLASSAAQAQSDTELTSFNKAELRERQIAIFGKMQAAPDDLELMLNYAAVSAALEDYEAAISTLERLLIFDPTIVRAKIELGVAYFRLGSYAVSEYYFKEALAQNNLSPEYVARVEEFLAAIRTRTAVNSFQGYATAGIVYSSNANQGPNSENISFLGRTAILGENQTAQDDVGLRVVVSGTHLYDLGRPSGDYWKTDASFFAVRYLEEEEGNYESLALRSGPVFKITDEAFGPTLRPFIEADAVRSDDQALYRTIGAGAELAYPLSDQYSLFSSLRVIERQFFDGNSEFDGFSNLGQAGMAYSPSPDLVLRGGYFFEVNRASADFNRYGEFGLRASASYKYAPGFSFVDRDWRIDGFAEISRRLYNAPNPTIDPDTERRDTEYRIGVNHTFYLMDQLFGQLTVDYLRRESNLANFELDGVTVAASIGRNF